MQPTGTIFSGQPITCINPSTTFTVTTNPPGSSISWYNSSNTYLGTGPMLTVTAIGMYNAVLTNTSNGCSNSISASANGNTVAPSYSVTGGGTVCLGTSKTLSVTGSYSYTWSTGAITNTINVIPTATSIYSVTAMNLVNGCTKTLTVQVNVNPGCSDVWPGDANSDGMCNNLDVLEIGLNASQIGPPRSSINNNWSAQYASNWSGTISNGKNRSHADCNGDGIVNANDTSAIFNNYSLSHVFKLSAINTTNGDINIVPDQTALPPGFWGSSSIYLGNNTNTITNIYGAAFDVTFDNSLIQTDSLYMVYASSFLNAGNTEINFNKKYFNNGVSHAAIVRTDQLNVSGYGKIATLYYKINNGISDNTLLNVGLSNSVKISASGSLTPLTSGSGTINITSLAAAINSLNSNISYFSIYPNPSLGILNIKTSNKNLFTLNIYNCLGELIYFEKETNGSMTISLEKFGAGVYTIAIINNEGVQITKVALN
ncbi:MAG: hypothetical protein JWO32_3070 [Bacteroidetes bacterium]|nr:hypothetical protein [Bacteroidota bacterium]